MFVVLDLQSVDDTEGESGINVEDDSINLNQEDEPERSTSASKRRHKRSKSDGQEQNEKPVKGTRGKRVKGRLTISFESTWLS